MSASLGGAPIAQALPMSIQGPQLHRSGLGVIASPIAREEYSASSPTEPMLQTASFSISTLIE